MSVAFNRKHLGGSLDDFLKEEGIYEEVCLRAAKKSLALKLQAQMKKSRVTKTAMARRMHTSRAAVDRLLDPDNLAVELSTISRAAAVLGRRLSVELR
jgi:hypothetical protein